MSGEAALKELASRAIDQSKGVFEHGQPEDQVLVVVLRTVDPANRKSILSAWSDLGQTLGSSARLAIRHREHTRLASHPVSGQSEGGGDPAGTALRDPSVDHADFRRAVRERRTPSWESSKSGWTPSGAILRTGRSLRRA